MKKSLLSHIQDEPEHVQAFYPGKSNMPRLSYKKAMSSYFLAGDGAIHQVSSCTVNEFKAFVEACAQTCKKQPTLKGLDYRELLARFFVLNELAIHGATVHLFSSEADARRVILEENEEKVPKYAKT